jgi:selenocysteine-specific elongation factor
MPIIGTAGHVDHGKSTLIRALTGRDPDRWAEEKERGLTIDLGFAWTDLGVGTEVGFVDVPGHERFIKNMLAGVGALDAALFVVAADEGWMPQSEEHMAVLDLLEVSNGVIALTRVDVADTEIAELAELEVDEQIAGTSLEGWPIVPVSAVTGEGMDHLAAALAGALTGIGEPDDRERPRVWIDRSFVISGAGVVITGTLTDGSIAVDDHLVVYPGGTPVRVRGLQGHEQKRATIGPGSRAAINLSGIDKDQVPRGAVLARSGQLVVSRRLLTTLRPVRGLDDLPSDRGAYHLHVGTAAVPARLQTIEGSDRSGIALLHLEDPVPVTMGDRFILRDTGRRAVVGGGRILDPSPSRRPAPTEAAILSASLDGNDEDRATALATVRGRVDVEQLRAASGGGAPANGVIAGRFFISPDRALEMTEELERVTTGFQDLHPLRPGIPKAELASQTGSDRAEIEALIARSGGRLVDDAATVRTPGFGVALSADEVEARGRARALLANSLAVPRASQLGLSPELVHALVRSDDLVRIDPDLVYLPEQITDITDRLAMLADGFTVANFRDELGLTRRQAIPLLEWLDAEGWTTRRGDGRIVRKRSG